MRENSSVDLSKEDEYPSTYNDCSNKIGKTFTLGPYPLDTVQQIDCIKAMQVLPSKCVDLAIADPPYNASKGGDWKWDNSVRLPGFGGNWEKVKASWDNMALGDYLSFTLAWLTELRRVVRPTGSIWIHGTYHNIGIINFALQLLEIEIINEIIWYKRNSFPNLSGRRLTASHETILWAHTGGKRRGYQFNYEESKNMPCIEDQLKAPGKQMRTVWDIPNNKEREEIRFGKHPTQKPIRLLRRMIKLSAKPEQICLVPFAGAGSECVAAIEEGLHFSGFESDPTYVEIACSRLKSITKDNKIHMQLKKHKQLEIFKYEISKENSYTPRHNAKNIPSLIKWTGSKRSQALTIASYIPEYSRYIEPFLGGGALLFITAVPGSIAGDIYEPLIDLWKEIQNDREKVIANYAEQWQLLHKDIPSYFYEVRDRFNREHDPLDLNFLMRTCVNGIVRFNAKGEFNNSFHLSRPGMSPERFKNIVKKWSDRIQGIEFICQDYLETISKANVRDFIYFDPPYAGNKQRYTENLDMQRFFEALYDLNSRGVKWALSFDGNRGDVDLVKPLPNDLYKRRILIKSGHSAVGKVLNGPLEMVQESLYLNY